MNCGKLVEFFRCPKSAAGALAVEAAGEIFNFDRFYCEVGQIMQSEERRVAGFLLLPGLRTIGADASEHPSAVFALGDPDDQHSISLRDKPVIRFMPRG